MFVEMAMMLVATARANITEATIFSFNVEIPFTFLPLFQKQLIRFEPESVRSTEDELTNVYLKTIAAGKMNAIETVEVDPKN